MTEAPVTPELSVPEAFDEALSRARVTDNYPRPVLKRLDPAGSPERMVAELRKMLSVRFFYAIPAAEAASLHRQATRALGRLGWWLRWHRVRIASVDVMLIYGWATLGLVSAVGLVAMAILYRDTIGGFFMDLLAPAPTTLPASGTPATTIPPAQSGPTVTLP